MKILRCSDVTSESCDYVAQGDDVGDVKDDLLDHFAQEHRTLWDITPKSEREDMIESIADLLQEAGEDTP